MRTTLHKHAREILAITREVAQRREDYDPGTDEWHTLWTLADAAEQLVSALPAELLPPEETRAVPQAQARLLDELLEALDHAGATKPEGP